VHFEIRLLVLLRPGIILGGGERLGMGGFVEYMFGNFAGFRFFTGLCLFVSWELFMAEELINVAD
jgi:hypothetical protein